MSLILPITSDRLKHALLIVICAGIVAYFIAHGILGERGFVALSQVEYQISDAKADLKKVQTERQTLEARTKLLRPDGLDLDMLDERARATLGYTKPSDYIILYNDKK
jgi:cell division protein FtsB